MGNVRAPVRAQDVVAAYHKRFSFEFAAADHATLISDDANVGCSAQFENYSIVSSSTKSETNVAHALLTLAEQQQNAQHGPKRSHRSLPKAQR
eukprot:556063-Alexandrium_andersonii.AAC.1